MKDELTLVLSDFQGPLDLLLHLIKQAKIDIYDIPIAKITEQYLAFLHQMQELRLDIAGDYLVMAATLMKIKSQLLLPQTPVVEEADFQETDPREELVAQLLAYEAYQKAANVLQEKAQERQVLFAKPMSLSSQEQPIKLAPGVIKLRDLTAVVNQMLEKAQNKQPRFKKIQREEFSIADKMQQIKIALKQGDSLMTFEDLVIDKADVDEIVTTFLALLELMKDHQVKCLQSDFQATITIEIVEEGVLNG